MVYVNMVQRVNFLMPYAVWQKALKGLMALLLTQCRLYCTFRDIIYHTCGLFIKSSKKIVWFKTSLTYMCVQKVFVKNECRFYNA